MSYMKYLAAGLMALTLTTGAALAQTDATTPIEIVDFGLGPQDAQVKIVEYASFTCPHCARFHSDVYPKLKADYIDTGKVRFEYREVYFDRYGLWAGMIARCGGEMRYFGILDLIFDTQKEWAGSDNPATVAENLKKIGRTAGLEDAAMDACLQDKPMAEAMLAHYQTNFAADGIQGTPTFMINGTKHSNMAYEEMKSIIDAELAK
jgi:protein-disulfide isomerase